MDDLDKFLKLFKALGDKTRLQIIATLADGDCTVRELAELLDKKEPTISEHLAQLKEVGLVTMRAEGNFRIYSYNQQALDEMNRELFQREQLAALMEKPEADRKILQNYLNGERLTTIPAGRKKLLVVLQWLTDKFERGRTYSEQEVNTIIKQHHDDYATLRREMIGYHLMKREKGIYWRTDGKDDDSNDNNDNNTTSNTGNTPSDPA